MGCGKLQIGDSEVDGICLVGKIRRWVSFLIRKESRSLHCFSATTQASLDLFHIWLLI
jgi:hypothetical protein